MRTFAANRPVQASRPERARAHRAARAAAGPRAAPALAGNDDNVRRDRLYRCGQFVLGSEPLAVPAHWPRVTIDETLVLRAHPELAVTQHAAGQVTLTLVGHMLDPHEPSAGNADILRVLAEFAADRTALLHATRRFGGRWLLIVNGAGQAYLFHDALGLRQAFVARGDRRPSICVASDAAVAAQAVGAAADPRGRAFLESAAFRADAEAAWPAGWTPYRGVQRLLPNHLFDLGDARPARYWPDARLVPLSLAEAAARSAALLRGMAQAAAERFEIAVAVTAGIDSRAVLAACRELGEGATYLTVHQWHQKHDHPDLAVAGAMLSDLGLRHEVVRAGADVDPRVAAVFRANSDAAHEHYLPDAAALYARFGRRKAALTGSGAEVGRCAFRQWLPFVDRLPITPRYLARLGGYGEEPVAVDSLAQWLDTVDARYGINPLDLFMWEIDCGCWLATVEGEFDIAWAEIFTPFNCRELLETMLATRPSLRKGSRPALFDETIRRLWPRLLDYPVNPHLADTLPRAWLRTARELLRIVLHPLRYGR